MIQTPTVRTLLGSPIEGIFTPILLRTSTECSSSHGASPTICAPHLLDQILSQHSGVSLPLRSLDRVQPVNRRLAVSPAATDRAWLVTAQQRCPDSFRL